MISAQLKAFLDTIAFSEIGERLLAKSDNGYDVVVGGARFKSYDDHPRVVVELKTLGIKSTAAGRYQILARYFDAYKKQLNLPDFSPASQDAIAIQLIKECDALDDIEAGHFWKAVRKCRSRWASFPCAGYGQHENKLDKLQDAFARAGGKISAADN